MRRVALLGATGSIGRQAIEIVAAQPDLTLCALQSGSASLDALAADHGVQHTQVGGDPVSLLERSEPDVVLNAVVGFAGIRGTLWALEHGVTLALANKESLVAAGELALAAKERGGGLLLPVDSEHSALHQCLEHRPPESVVGVVLTASGGPFRGRRRADLASVTPPEALAHPTWRMGPKITVDSATLTNKGFEVVEARWLYDLTYDRIDVVVHPESIVHAMVELADGSVKAELAEPDMRLFIQYALLWRHAPAPTRPMDWVLAKTLRFMPVEASRYPCLGTVLETARSGDLNAMIGLVAADEVAVQRFLRGEIGFGEIAVYLHRGATLGRAHGRSAEPSLAEIRHIDAEVRAALRAEPVLH